MGRNVPAAKEVFAEIGIDLDVRAPVYQLGIADRQFIEIAKSLISGARVLILDEPTSVLSSREVDSLFALLNSLRARGISLVFVSHKLDEVKALTDRVVVLRDGVLIAEKPTAELSISEMVHMMCGRDIGDLYPSSHAPVATPFWRSRISPVLGTSKMFHSLFAGEKFWASRDW